MNGHLTRPPPNSLDSSYFLFVICHGHFFINPARQQEGRLLLDFIASEPLLSSFLSNSFMLRLHPSHQPRLRQLSPLQVKPLTSGVANSHGVTGGVYKTRERIHRDMLIRDY